MVVTASFVLSAVVDRKPEFEEVQQVTVSYFSVPFCSLFLWWRGGGGSNFIDVKKNVLGFLTCVFPSHSLFTAYVMMIIVDL